MTQSHHGNCSVFFDVMVTRVWLYGGAGVIEELWATRFIILIGPKSQSHHTPSGWYVGDVPIEQAQPSNGDPKWHVKTHG